MLPPFPLGQIVPQTPDEKVWWGIWIDPFATPERMCQYSKIWDLAKRCNDRPVEPFGLEHVLIRGSETRRRWSDQGPPVRMIRFRFSAVPRSQNEFLHPDGGYRRVIPDLYTGIDFSARLVGGLDAMRPPRSDEDGFEDNIPGDTPDWPSSPDRPSGNDESPGGTWRDRPPLF